MLKLYANQFFSQLILDPSVTTILEIFAGDTLVAGTGIAEDVVTEALGDTPAEDSDVARTCIVSISFEEITT